MKKIIFLSCLFVTACDSATKNETADLVCQSLNTTIDNKVTEIADSLVEGDSRDVSAAQQSARLALINAKLEVIQINLKLLSENGCKFPTKSIDPFQL